MRKDLLKLIASFKFNADWLSSEISVIDLLAKGNSKEFERRLLSQSLACYIFKKVQQDFEQISYLLEQCNHQELDVLCHRHDRVPSIFDE